MSKFTYIELFAGIGGFRQALDKLGGNCVFASEIDKFASQAYQTLYGDAHLYGDITKINEKDIPNHDLIVAGIPCQAFSVAGKRLGFDDTRGTLFFDVVRIAKEKQPKSVIIENVKGLVGHDKGKTLDTIIKTLNDIGYRVDFEVLNSKFFGVPQNRERIFIVAVREDLVDNEAWTNVKGATVVPKGKRRISGYTGEDAWELKTFNFDFPANDKVTSRLRDILETEVDEKYYLDDEKTAKLVAQLEAKKPDERMSRQAIETFNESEQPKEHGDMIQAYNRQHLKDGICPTLTTRPEGFKTASLPIVEGIAIKEATKKGYTIAEEGDSVNVQFPDSKTRRGRVGKQVANTLEDSSINRGVVTTEERHNGEEKERNTVEILRVLQEEIGEEAVTEWRLRILDSFQSSEILQYGLYEETSSNKLSTYVIGEQQSEECEIKSRVFHRLTDLSGMWLGQEFRCSSYRREPLQQFAREFSIIMSELSQQNPQTREVVQDLWETAEGSRILQQALYKVQEIWRPDVQRTRYRIRKLSPLECWRLQGFLDDAHEAVKQAGLSDSQRYKQAGNAVTVNVIEAIGERLVKYL